MLRFNVSLKTSLIRVRRAVLDTPEKIWECLLLLPTTFLRMTPRQRKVNVKAFNISKYLFWKWVITVSSSYCTFCSFGILKKLFSLPAFWNFPLYLLLFDIIIMYISFFVYCLFRSVDRRHVAWMLSYYNYSVFHWCCLEHCLACIRCSWNVCQMNHKSISTSSLDSGEIIAMSFHCLHLWIFAARQSNRRYNSVYGLNK